MLRAAGHENLGRVIAQSLFDGQLLGNGAFELLNAGGSGVFGKSGPDSGFCGRFDGLRGIPVRLARGEINDIDALRHHRFRRGGDAEGRGGDDASCAGRQLHGLCLRSRWQRRVATSGWRKSVTGPSSRATSLMILEVRYEYSSLGIKNTVSMVSSSLRFNRAIWNSYSKSEIARNPRITACAPHCLTYCTSSPSNAATSTRARSLVTTRTISTRSVKSNSGCLLGLGAATATMTLSKSRRLRLMMSVWPWVMGSNVPGYTPIFMGSGAHPEATGRPTGWCPDSYIVGATADGS